MFKGFSFFGSRKGNPRTQSLERATRSKPRSTPSVYVPDDCPGWFITWKTSQKSVQPARTIEQVARLSPAEFISRRPLAGFQEEVIDGKKKYKKVATREWDTLRASKVYKGEVSMKKKFGESGQDEKLQYLRCLDQRRRVLFIPLSTRGDFFVASTAESQTTLPPRRSQNSPLPPIPTVERVTSAPSVGSPDSGVQMRKKSPEPSNFENFLKWQQKVNVHDERRNSGEFEHTFPRSEIIVNRHDINRNQRNMSIDHSVGRASSGISASGGGSIATGTFEEEDPYKRHFDIPLQRTGYYTGERTPPNYQDVLNGMHLRSATSFNNAVFQSKSAAPHMNGAPMGLTSLSPPQVRSPVQNGLPTPIPPERKNRKANKQAEDRNNNVQANARKESKPQINRPNEKELRKDPHVDKTPNVEQKKAAQPRKDRRESEGNVALNKRERFWSDFFKTPS